MTQVSASTPKPTIVSSELVELEQFIFFWEKDSLIERERERERE